MTIKAPAEVVGSKSIDSKLFTRNKLIEYAKKDVNAFADYVVRDTYNNAMIRQAVIHKEWQHMFDSHDRVVIWAPRASGKTQQITCRVLYELGRNPNIRIAIICSAHQQAEERVLQISQYIKDSKELKDVFPELQPDGDLPWSASRLYIKRQTKASEPSVQAFGCKGSILGKRVDLLILDDVVDFESSRTAALRKEAFEWYTSTITGILTQDSRVIAIGTPWFTDDLLYRLAHFKGWVAKRYPIYDSNGNIIVWPQKFTEDYITRIRNEITDFDFNRQYLCNPRTEADLIFQREWIEIALHRGREKALNRPKLTNGRLLPAAPLNMPSSYKVYMGVDLAVQRKDSSDRTAIFVLANHPNQTREVLYIESGKWHFDEIINKIISIGNRFGPTCIMVENNGAQEFLVQALKGRCHLPVRSFTTTNAKSHPEFGVAGIGDEMAKGHWIVPNEDGNLHPEVARWVEEMLDYDPKSHTGDILMASWFAREGARQGAKKVERFCLDLFKR